MDKIVERMNLTEAYSIARIIKGGWQLAGGHGRISPEQAIEDMLAYYDAGITTFDCADIYTGVEELIGTFLKKLKTQRGNSEIRKVQIHTKYVPDIAELGKLNEDDIRNSINRSIHRLGVEALDLVQFHYWDFNVPGYVEIALILSKLQEKGLIRHIGVTNFDVEHIKELEDAGVSILTNQVQYSVLDKRPEKTLQPYCSEKNMSMLCYGGLAGGFLSDKYLGIPEPTDDALRHNNRSLVKYKLIIDEAGGYDKFQEVLKALSNIGKGYNMTISETTLSYVLQKPRVSAVIVGSRDSKHLDSLKKLGTIKISKVDMKTIDVLTEPLVGDIYHLERYTDRHKKIMKFNLNKEKI